MTPSEEIKNMLIPILSSMRAHGSTEAEIIAYRNGFTTGAMWRQTHPHWISVDDELPPRGRTDPNVSVPVITCKIVNRELHEIGFQQYIFGKGKWKYCDATHWMPLPQAPVVSNPSDTGKKSNFDENCEKYRTVFDGWEELTFKERRDRINKFRSGQW